MKARDIGRLDTPKVVRNLWNQKDIADFTEDFTHRVEPHDTILLKITA